MDLKQAALLAVQISIIATVFGFGLKATFADLSYLVNRPALLARSLLAMLVVMPVVAIVLVRTFDVVRIVEIAIVALAISPVPPLLPNRQRIAGGAVFYGLGLMVTLAVLSIVVIPLWVEVLERILDQSLGMPWPVVAGLLLKTFIGPLVIGILVHRLGPTVASRIAGPMNTLAVLMLAVGVLVLLAISLPVVWQLIGDGTVLALAVFIIIGLGVGHGLGGPGQAHASVLALSTSCRHPILAMTIAATNFPEERFGGVIVLYLLLNLLLSVPYILWVRRQNAAASAV